MPNEYYMPPENPCPACGGSHYFRQQDGVPYWAEGQGSTFEVTCPTTNKRVEVKVHPDEKPFEKPVTETLCSTCSKANYFVFSQSKPRGRTVDQRLRCSNPDCGHEAYRKIDMVSGKVILQPS